MGGSQNGPVESGLESLKKLFTATGSSLSYAIILALLLLTTCSQFRRFPAIFGRLVVIRIGPIVDYCFTTGLFLLGFLIYFLRHLFLISDGYQAWIESLWCPHSIIECATTSDIIWKFVTFTGDYNIFHILYFLLWNGVPLFVFTAISVGKIWGPHPARPWNTRPFDYWLSAWMTQRVFERMHCTELSPEFVLKVQHIDMCFAIKYFDRRKLRPVPKEEFTPTSGYFGDEITDAAVSELYFSLTYFDGFSFCYRGVYWPYTAIDVSDECLCQIYVAVVNTRVFPPKYRLWVDGFPHHDPSLDNIARWLTTREIFTSWEDLSDLPRFTPTSGPLRLTDVGSLERLIMDVHGMGGPLSNFGIELSIFCYRVLSTDKYVDFGLATFHFVKGVDMLGVLKRKKILFTEYLMKLVRDFLPQIYSMWTEKFTPTSWVGFTKLIRNIVETDSSVLIGLRNILLAIVGLKFFSKDTAYTLHRHFGSTGAPTDTLGALRMLVSSVCSLLAYGSDVLHGRADWLSSSDPVSEFESGVADLYLVHTNKLTYVGTPEPGKVDLGEYRHDIDMAVKTGEHLLSVTPRSLPAYKRIHSSLTKMKVVRANLFSQQQSNSRQAPYGIILYGPPGIGKSTLITLSARIAAVARKRGFDPSHIYPRNPADEYFSGYTSQPVLHYSELGSLHASIAAKSGDPLLNEVLSIVDNAAFAVPMADLESKGNKFALFDTVIADVNDPQMNLDVCLNNPAAARRRFLWVEVKVKSEWSTSTGALDTQKIRNATPEQYDDYWIFKIYRHMPITNQTTDIQELLTTESVREFSKFLKEDMEDFIARQDNAVNNHFDVEAFLTEDIVPTTGLTLYSPFATILLLFAWARAWWELRTYAFFSTLSAILRPQAETTFITYLPNHLLGALVKRYFRRPMTPCLDIRHAAALTAVISCFLYFVIRKSDEFEPTGNYSTHVQPEIEKVEENVGAKAPPPLSKRDGYHWTPSPVFNQDGNCETGADVDVIDTRANANLVLVCNKHDRTKNMGLGICEDIAIVNSHFFHNGDKFELHVSRPGRQFGKRIVCVTRDDLFQSEEPDVTFVRLRGCRFKDISQLFVTKIPTLPNRGVTGLFRGDVTVLKPYASTKGDYKDKSIHWINTFLFEATVEQGECATPITVSFGKSNFIAGILVGSVLGTSKSLGTFVLKSYVDAAISHFRDDVILPTASAGCVRTPKKDVTLIDVHKKHPTIYEDAPSVNVHGQFSNYVHQTPGKSRVKSTVLIHHSEELVGVSPFCDGKPIYGPPPMSSVVRNGVYCAPFNYWLRKVGTVKTSLDTRVMRKVIKFYTERIVKGLGDTKLSPLPFLVAQNGTAENAYCRAMNMSSSGGIVFNGTKRKYAYPTELDFKVDAYVPNPEVQAEVAECLRCYDSGITYNPLLGGQLKDEPREFEKCRLAKTRVFCAGSYETILVQRMYLQPFFSLMMQHSRLFQTAVGINMHGLDVDLLVKEMLAVGDRFFEGDYKGFDTSMSPDIRLMGNSVVYDVCKALGYNEVALQHLRCTLADTLHCNVAVQGVIVETVASLPSGMYGTAELNSLNGVCMLLYAWFSIFEDTPFEDKFFELTATRTYGDDVFQAISPKIISRWNNRVYQTFCQNTFGIEFTSATKSSEMEISLNISQLSFLKRNFVYCAVRQRWIAPLLRVSLMKTICYLIESRAVSFHDQLLDSTISCLRELFFHISDKDEYDEKRRAFAQIVAPHVARTPADLLSLYPTWTEIEESVNPSDVECA